MVSVLLFQTLSFVLLSMVLIELILVINSKELVIWQNSRRSSKSDSVGLVPFSLNMKQWSSTYLLFIHKNQFSIKCFVVHKLRFTIIDGIFAVPENSSTQKWQIYGTTSKDFKKLDKSVVKRVVDKSRSLFEFESFLHTFLSVFVSYKSFFFINAKFNVTKTKNKKRKRTI